MIEPGELHRYFAVRAIDTGREVWLMNWDVRYEATGDRFFGHYRSAPDGEYFLVELRGAPVGQRGFLLSPDEVEPLPDGRGLYHPDHLEGIAALSLQMTYEGSWRQYADHSSEEASQ